MKYFFYLILFLTIISCTENDKKKDTETNTYYSKYLEIYNSYETNGAEKTIIELDEYIAEFPNAQNAYIFKAWILANNSEIEKADAIFEKALEFDSTNVDVYHYWSSLLMLDTNKFEKAKKINELGFLLDSDNLMLKNNLTWQLLFEEKNLKALENAVHVVEEDTSNNSLFLRTQSIASISNENDSLFDYSIQESIKYGLKDSMLISIFKESNITLHELYKKSF